MRMRRGWLRGMSPDYRLIRHRPIFLIASAGPPGARGDFLAFLDGVEELEMAVDGRGGVLAVGGGSRFGLLVGVALVVAQADAVRGARGDVAEVDRNFA